jgi:hypothetical protein
VDRGHRREVRWVTSTLLLTLAERETHIKEHRQSNVNLIHIQFVCQRGTWGKREQRIVDDCLSCRVTYSVIGRLWLLRSSQACRPSMFVPSSFLFIKSQTAEIGLVNMKPAAHEKYLGPE